MTSNHLMSAFIVKLYLIYIESAEKQQIDY